MAVPKNNKVIKPQPKSWQQRLVERLFVPLKDGRLTMVLPDGGERCFGDGQGGVQARMVIRSDRFFKKCVLAGDVGFGESYVDADWDSEDVVKVVEWMIRNVDRHPTLVYDRKKRIPANFWKVFNRILHAFRENTLGGSRRNIKAHYDLNNKFFAAFLDPSMTYSSAYFFHVDQSLEEAQRSKYELLCRKLCLTARDHVLEIGCGWGGFAVYAAKHYGCRVTAATISRAQFEYAKERTRAENLSSQIDLRLEDYRQLRGKFDKIVSIEMIEAVGHKFLKTFFSQCHALLKREGILGLQMILCPDNRYENFRQNVDWIQKHIFPGSLLPSLRTVIQAMNKTGNLCLFDFEDMTRHYARTLALWRENFDTQVDNIRELGFDGSFVRKWRYYLSYCEAAFKTRNIFVAQAVFARPNNLTLSESFPAAFERGGRPREFSLGKTY